MHYTNDVIHGRSLFRRRWSTRSGTSCGRTPRHPLRAGTAAAEIRRARINILTYSCFLEQYYNCIISSTPHYAINNQIPAAHFSALDCRAEMRMVELFNLHYLETAA